MCEFHLKEKCFHPQKVQRGIIAIPCEVHNCTKCTDINWQKNKIKEQVEYHYGIIKATKQQLPSFNMEENNSASSKRSGITKIFG